MLEADGFARDAVIHDLERRRLGAREDRERVGLDLDFTGGQVWVLVTAAFHDRAGYADAELAAQLAGQRVRVRVRARFEHDLGQAAAIAEIDEHAAAVVASRGHPAKQNDALAGVGGAQRAAVMGSFQVGKELGHGRDFITAIDSACW